MKLFNWSRKFWGKPKRNELKCFECGSTDFFEGPSGGAGVMIACAKCDHRYIDLGPYAGLIDRGRSDTPLPPVRQ